MRGHFQLHCVRYMSSFPYQYEHLDLDGEQRAEVGVGVVGVSDFERQLAVEHNHTGIGRRRVRDSRVRRLMEEQ